MYDIWDESNLQRNGETEIEKRWKVGDKKRDRGNQDVKKIVQKDGIKEGKWDIERKEEKTG